MLPSRPPDPPLPLAAARRSTLRHLVAAAGPRRWAGALLIAGGGGAMLPSNHGPFTALVGDLGLPPELAAVVAISALGVGVWMYAPRRST
jgi:hypothetical protein